MCCLLVGACPYNRRFWDFEVDVWKILENEKILLSENQILSNKSKMKIFFKIRRLYGHALPMAASFPTEIALMRHSMLIENCSRLFFCLPNKVIFLRKPEVG